MSTPTWDEYLAEAAAHLAAVRRAAEWGAPPPSGPLRPEGPIPEHRRSEAQRLAVGYDQLAVEVATRMSAIESRRQSGVGRNPHRERPPAHFFDAPA
jgi:hypothetical protein